MHMTQQPMPPAGDAYLRSLWNFIQRNRWLTLGIPVLVVALAGAFLTRATPVYEASTTLRIDEDRSNVPVLDALRTLSSGSQIGTETEVLRSRTIAEAVVDRLDLGVVVRRPRGTPRAEVFSVVDVERTAPRGRYRLEPADDGRLTLIDRRTRESLGDFTAGQTIRLPGVTLRLADSAVDLAPVEFDVVPFQDAVRALRRTLGVSRPNREADLLLVRYEGTDPALVRAVPDAVADAFMQRRTAVRSAEARGTVRFLQTQLDTLAAQLTAAEEALRAFQEANRIVAPEAEAEVQVQRLAQLRAERETFDAERAALAGMLERVESAPPAARGEPSPMRRLIAFPTLLRNEAASELLRSLNEVENQRAELLRRRTWEDPDVQLMTGRIDELETQLGTIARTYLDALTRQVAALDAALERFSDQLARVPEAHVRFARLTRQTRVLEEIYTLLQTRLKETEIIAAAEDPSVQVIDPAILPTRPIRPNIPLTFALALLVGVVLGTGTAFAREHMDTRIRSRDDLRVAAGDIPVLGTIPRIRRAQPATGLWSRLRTPAPQRRFTDSMHARLEAIHDPQSPVSEAYRSLRTNIAFARADRAPRTLVFTSPNPGEGKSTSAVNLVTTLAQQGLRCLLVDADMRRGVLHEVLRVPREPGLSNLLVGGADLATAIQTVAPGDGVAFSFLAAGTPPPNPAELIASERMSALLEQLAEFDAVILDAPPMNLVTDAALLGTRADGVIVVARSGVTDRGALAYAMQQLAAVRAPVLGAVLNDVDERKERYYGSYGGASGYYAARYR